MESHKRSRFFSNTVALIVQTVVATVVTLVQVKILSNSLSKDTFGLFVSLRGLSLLISMLAANGLPALLVRFLPAYERAAGNGRTHHRPGGAVGAPRGAARFPSQGLSLGDTRR